MSETKDDEWKFDVIVLGTGLKECILSALMSLQGKKVLHMDSNDFYGNEEASPNLKTLVADHRGPGQQLDVKRYGKLHSYNVDLAPKFLMASGTLVKILQVMKVTEYINFRGIMGSYVFHSRALHKVPATAREGLSSKLLGMMQTYRFKGFIEYVNTYESNDAKTHGGLDLNTMTMAQVYRHFSLDTTVQTFISHALALEPDNAHLSQPAKPVIEKIKCYAYSVLRFGNSPYIYPCYGVGNLPEAFSRFAALRNGMFMLSSNVSSLNYGDDGKVTGLTFTHEAVDDGKASVATAPIIICDPRYLAADDVTQTGQIARCVVIMTAPIPNTNDQGNGQIIIPNIEVKRQNDVYMSCLSGDLEACPQGRYLAIMSTTVEGAAVGDITDKKACAAACDRELKHALALIPRQNILDKFTWVTNSKRATNGAELAGKNVFCTTTTDASTHFQAAMVEVLAMYQSITGEELNLTMPETTKEAE